MGIAFWQHRLNFRHVEKAVAASFKFSMPSASADTSVEHFAGWQGIRRFHVERGVFEDEAKQVCSFYLVPADGQMLKPFLPGQYLTFQLAVPGHGRAAKAITRCYSLSDSPNPKHYRISVKRVASADPGRIAPGVSSNYFHDNVIAGSVLNVMAPAGKFFLAAGNLPVVLIGGGIGITPMMSMLLWCLEHQPGRVVSLYYGVRSLTELAFQSVLEALAEKNPQFALHVVYSDISRPSAFSDKNHYFGQIDVALLKQTLPHGPHQFYVCGPTAMMESLVPALAQWGVPLSDIHFEAFGPASIRLAAQQSTDDPINAPTAQPALEIRFKASQRSLAWNHRQTNLLDFAQSHGIAVESGCRSGSCGSCATPLLSGEVFCEHTPDFELLPGQCLLCVGRPASALVLGI